MSMVKYIENGKCFTRKGPGVNTCFSEVSKEEYERLSAMPDPDADHEVMEGLSISVLMGYGYYGHELREKDGVYYVGKNIGNSCD